MLRIEPHSQTSIRHSTRVSKPSARKRANSEFISQLPYSSQRAKRPFRPSLPSASPRWQRTATDVVDDADAGEDASENIGEDKDAGSDAGDDAGENDDEDIASSIIDDELEDEEEKEEDTMRYLSIWNAIVNGKEVLCSKSRLFTADMTIYSIQCWQREVLENAAPRQLKVTKLEAITLYECCRALDECPIELRGHRDIYDATEILRITIDRRTTTQRQIAELPDILQSETVTGNSMPQVADHWICLNTPLPYPPPYTPPVPSSPICSSSDPNEVLAQFFNWLTVESNIKQMELLENVKNKLLDEDWNLDTLRDERKGGAMTTAIWESYGFKLGTLANIRSRISEFKQQ
ncbi:MAG: hypothetical protein M1840_005106 [Geoglossum simile]|nr:MAG: hypothetical protein M1840_005106 [Geoglossum simile]